MGRGVVAREAHRAYSPPFPGFMMLAGSSAALRRRSTASPAAARGGPALGDGVPLLPLTLRLAATEHGPARRGDEPRRARREQRCLSVEAVEDEQHGGGPGRVAGGELEAGGVHARAAQA